MYLLCYNCLYAPFLLALEAPEGEADASPAALGPGGHRVLVRPLARAAHDDQIAVRKLHVHLQCKMI